MQGYRFTQRVRRLLEFAREEAVRQGCEYISPDHFLLGLIREGEGVGVLALAELAGDVGELRDQLEAVLSHSGPRSAIPDSSRLPYTARAKHVLDVSREVAGRSAVATEHVLIALVKQREGFAAALLLQERGITEERVRAAVEKVLGEHGPDEWSEEHEHATAAAQPKAVRVVISARFHDGAEATKECATLQEAVTFLVMSGMT